MRTRKPMYRRIIVVVLCLLSLSAAAKPKSPAGRAASASPDLGDFPQANKYYWLARGASVRLCPKPAPDILDRVQCPEVTSGKFTVTEVVLFNQAPAYYRIEMDGGSAGYVRAEDKASFLAEDPQVLAQAPRVNCLKLGKPKIGMTTAEAQKTCWAKPQSINRTTAADHIREQYVYGNGRYLYFDNGILVAIEPGH